MKLVAVRVVSEMSPSNQVPPPPPPQGVSTALLRMQMQDL